MNAKDRKGRSGLRTATVGLTALAALIMALTLTEFERRVASAENIVRRARETVISLHTVDGLEWRIRAGDDHVVLIEQIRDESAELLRGVEFLDPKESNGLQDVAPRYLAAVNDEVTAITRGHVAEAKLIDKTPVDVAFERLLSVASAIARRHEDRGRDLRRQIIVFIWVATLVMGAGLVWALLYLQRRHERNESFERRLQNQVRFRRLVEGSNDVITVASGDCQLQVMSFAHRRLGRASTLTDVTRVDDLIGGANLDLWRDADKRVQLGESLTINVPLSRADGSTTYVEAHGSQLDDAANERAWVWRDVTDRIALERQLTYEAFHDSLTGAANRALLRDRIQHTLARSNRSGQPVTVLFFDLDNFKTVNDSLGHALGDNLLCIITDRVRTCARESDTVARLGGDEFAVLIEDGDEQVGRMMAERIIAAVLQGVVLDGTTVFPSASVGIAASRPGDTTDDLLRNADTAMFAAKRAGKGRHELFDERMHQAAIDHLQLQAEIRTALDRGDFTVHYQPTVSLRTGMVDGVEALARWDHPTRGPISPAEFIPVAESSGLIVSLGAWVLAEACRTATELPFEHANPDLGNPNLGNKVSMHVNLSPRQLLDPKLEETISETLRETGLSPDVLVLEVTESLLLDQVNAVKRLDALHALGVRIAIDDFGTGYTSISYLQRLPVDILKIDRSFVSGRALADGDRAAFLQAIVGLAKSLKLRTVAEGIEDPEQLSELGRLGCESGQGFLWTPAVPAETLHATIRAINADAALVHAINDSCAIDDSREAQVYCVDGEPAQEMLTPLG